MFLDFCAYSHMNKMGKKTQSCPTQDSNMKSKPNLLYTDLKGLQQLKRVVKAGIGQYRLVLHQIISSMNRNDWIGM